MRLSKTANGVFRSSFELLNVLVAVALLLRGQIAAQFQESITSMGFVLPPFPLAFYLQPSIALLC